MLVILIFCTGFEQEKARRQIAKINNAMCNLEAEAAGRSSPVTMKALLYSWLQRRVDNEDCCSSCTIS